MCLLSAASSTQTILCLILIQKSYRNTTSTHAFAVKHNGIHLPAYITQPSAHKTASHNTLQALRNLQCTSVVDLWWIIVYNQVYRIQKLENFII